MLSFLQGYKTVIVFTLTGLLGLVVALQSINFSTIFLPLICHVDPTSDVTAVPCAVTLTKYLGYWTAALSAVAIGLRAITASSIFTAIFPTTTATTTTAASSTTAPKT